MGLQHAREPLVELGGRDAPRPDLGGFEAGLQQLVDALACEAAETGTTLAPFTLDISRSVSSVRRLRRRRRRAPGPIC